jgi:hypothetical protein
LAVPCSEMLSIRSKLSPHSSQRYAYVGIAVASPQKQTNHRDRLRALGGESSRHMHTLRERHCPGACPLRTHSRLRIAERGRRTLLHRHRACELHIEDEPRQELWFGSQFVRARFYDVEAAKHCSSLAYGCCVMCRLRAATAAVAIATMNFPRRPGQCRERAALGECQ